MARAYVQAANQKAFVHVFDELAGMRKQFVESLIHENDAQRCNQLRGSIFVIDSLRRLPEEMVRHGAEAETALQSMGEIADE